MFPLVGTSDDYSSDTMSVAPDDGSSNNDGPVCHGSLSLCC